MVGIRGDNHLGCSPLHREILVRNDSMKMRKHNRSILEGLLTQHQKFEEAIPNEPKKFRKVVRSKDNVVILETSGSKRKPG